MRYEWRFRFDKRLVAVAKDLNMRWNNDKKYWYTNDPEIGSAIANGDDAVVELAKTRGVLGTYHSRDIGNSPRVSQIPKRSWYTDCPAPIRLSGRKLEREIMYDFIKDLAENGLRCDLNPTLRLSDANTVAQQMYKYLTSQNSSIVQRAKQVLHEIEELHKQNEEVNKPVI